MADFSIEVFRLLLQRINTDKTRNHSLQSQWGSLFRSSVNKDSGLLDIQYVANFHGLSDAHQKEQYEPYQKSLESKVFLIVRAYNAQKHERRPIDEIENGTEFSQIHFCNPFQRLDYGQRPTHFQRGGTTADNLMRMTGKNIAVLSDAAVKKMHKNITEKQFSLIQSYMHEGWPEELELPEWTSNANLSYKGLYRLNIRRIFNRQMRSSNLLLANDDPGIWVVAALPATPAPTAFTCMGTSDFAGLLFVQCTPLFCELCSVLTKQQRDSAA